MLQIWKYQKPITGNVQKLSDIVSFLEKHASSDIQTL